MSLSEPRISVVEVESQILKLPGLREVRVVSNKPVADGQWALTVVGEKLPLPSFIPGQFCMLSLPIECLEPLLPRPFAIVERTNDQYLFIYRVVGTGTSALQKLSAGARLNLLGPLGRGITLKALQSPSVFICGGVGYASVLPLIDVSPESSLLYYGVKKDRELIRHRLPKQTIFSSDDGSLGRKGYVTDLVKSEIKTWLEQARIYVCGPRAMMYALWDLLPKERSYYFLEETMGCGVGICVGCIVAIENEQQQIEHVRSCLSGPIFKGSELKPWRHHEWASAEMGAAK